jgi:hypothetical protein
MMITQKKLSVDSSLKRAGPIDSHIDDGGIRTAGLGAAAVRRIRGGKKKNVNFEECEKKAKS